jgi:hypothetical protein
LNRRDRQSAIVRGSGWRTAIGSNSLGKKAKNPAELVESSKKTSYE